MKNVVRMLALAALTLMFGHGCGGGSSSGTSTGQSGSATVAAARSSSGSSTTPTYALSAWNDLGMHCVDGNDYSIMSILPPYNNLHAQLVNKSTNKQVTSGVTITYEATADLTGSINTSSAGKTNFWQYVASLFGVSLPDDVGLTGNPTASRKAAPMKFNATWNWFEADGIPITPYDDAGNKNFYPMVNVVAKDSRGKVLATAKAVLPVSDEMTCQACHASRASGTAAEMAARPPISGWAFDATDPQKDWKKNVLRIHDDKQKSNAAFQQALMTLQYNPAGLTATAAAGRPILCAACHSSNALPGTGLAGISPITAAQHRSHGQVVDPSQNLKLDDITNRSACYMCHPGSVTKLRHHAQRAGQRLLSVPLQFRPRQAAVRGLPRRHPCRVPQLARERQRAERVAAGLPRHGQGVHGLPRDGAQHHERRPARHALNDPGLGEGP